MTSAGTACLAAALASSPNVACLPPGPVTTPFFTLTDLASTFQRWAAAATSIARAAAPAWRYWMNELASDDEPPVPCAGPHERLL